MRELLKSVGQLLTGIGLFVAAMTYLFVFRSQNAKTNRETRGLLLLLGAELDNQMRSLQHLHAEPERLANTTGESIETSVWDANTERIARFLSVGDFGLISTHYADIKFIRDQLPRPTVEGEVEDELRWFIQASVEGLPFLQQRVHIYIVNLEESQLAGK